MSDDAPPPGVTVDSDEDSSPIAMDATPPPGVKIDEDDDAPRAAPVRMPTTAQLTDPNADQGALARQQGEALAAGNGPDETHGAGLKEYADAAAALGSGALVGSIGGGAASLTARIKASVSGDKTPDQAAADAKKWVDQNAVYHAQTPGGQQLVNAVGGAGDYVAAPYKREEQAAERALGPTAGGILHTAVGTAGDVLNAAPAAGLVGGAADLARSEAATLNVPGEVADTTATAPTAANVLAFKAANSKGNMGAAEAPISLEGTSPELQSAVANSKNPNTDALNRHIDAETLPQPEGSMPLRLRLGQATRNDQQISDEKNMRADPDTQGILTDSINDQNSKLGTSMGEIRRQAMPDIVQLSNADHGQSTVDAIKSYDNDAVSDIRQKYKALEQAAGGAMPIDTGATIEGIRSALREKLLTSTAMKDPAISEVMESLDSGKPMSFETFNSALSNLAEVQRARGTPAAAATVVRNALESMPLTPEAANLKGLRDVAAGAAKRRFDTIEQNPAYDAAINDNVPKTPNGLHVVGAPSPLADSFMNQYFLGDGKTASRAYVARLKGVMASNPDFSPAIEAAALNKLRDAAGLNIYDSGNFAHANFGKAHSAMAKKADVLLSPQTAEHVDQLRRVSDDVAYEGKGASTNRSGTALALQRHGAQFDVPPESPQTVAGTLLDLSTDALAAHAGPAGYVTKRLGSALWKGHQAEKAAAEAARIKQSIKDAKVKFAQEATAPGAGIDTPAAAPAPSVIARASGGKVDHEALVNRLFTRWKKAQKDSDKSTEPLLKFPDETITKALRLADVHS